MNKRWNRMLAVPMVTVLVATGMKGMSAESIFVSNAKAESVTDSTTISFGSEQIVLTLGEETEISVNVPEEYKNQIEWTLTIKPLNGNDTTEYFSWADEDSNGASRKLIGHAVKEITPYSSTRVVGTVTATIKGTNQSATVQVVVKSKPATGMDLCYNGQSVVGETLVLIQGRDSTKLLNGVSLPKGTNEQVTFKSSDTSVATVDKYGSVVGKSKGTATITATCESGFSASCTVEVYSFHTMENKLEYIENMDGEALIFYCPPTVATGEYKVPSAVDGKTVVGLANESYNYCDKLTKIFIPETVVEISDKSLNKESGVVIAGKSGSYAETYAKEHGFTFENEKGEITQGADVEPTATAEPTADVEPTATAEPTVTVEPTATAEPTVTVEPTATVAPPATVAPTATVAPPTTVAPTATVEPTVTVTPTMTPVPNVTAAPTNTPGTDWGLEESTSNVKKASISWTKKATKLKVGKKYTFKVKRTNTSAKLVWSVSDKKKASITQKGVLKAKKAGKVKVTVKCGKLKLAVTVTIKKK